MDITLRGLMPDRIYSLQARATAGPESSEWSPELLFRTGTDEVAPRAPSNFAVEVSGNTFKATWDRPTENEDGTLLRDFKNYVIVIRSIETGAEVSRTTVDTSLDYDFWTNYNDFGGWRAELEFRAYSVDLVGNMSQEPAIVTVEKAPPGPPTNLVVRASGQAFIATWDAPVDSDVMDYEVSVTNGTVTKLYYVTDRTFELTFAENNSIFNGYKPTATFVVRTRDTANQLSEPTPPVTVSKPKPKAPTNPTWTLDGSTFTGTWDAVTQAVDNSPLTDLRGYTVTLTAGTKTAEFFTPDTKFVLTEQDNIGAFRNIQANITFTVRALDGVYQWSDPTAAISAGNAAPAAPTGVTVTGGTDTILVNWTAPADTDIASYEIYSAASVGANGVLQGRVAAPATQYSFTSVVYGTQIYAYVVAVDQFGTPSPRAYSSNSAAPSSPFTVDTTAPPRSGVPTVTAPTGRTAAQSSALLISWVAPAGIADLAGYQIRYSVATTAARTWQYADVGEKTATSLLVEGLSSNTPYVAQVRPYDTMINTPTWSDESAPGTSTTSTQPAQDISSGISILTGGTLRSANYDATLGNGWLLQSSGLDIQGGSINARVIKAGSLVSTAMAAANSTQPAWSLNLAGNMSINDAQVRGKIVVGSGSDSAAIQAATAIASHTVGGTGSQWTIKGDGTFDIKTGTGQRVQLSSAGLYGHDGAKRTFELNHSGLYVDGNINAGSGSFYGTVSVTGGGHLEVQGSDAYVIVRRPSTGEWVMLDGRTTTESAISSSTGRFNVDYYGNLTASNANLSGSITSTSGSIGGFTINGSSGLYAGSGTSRVQMQPGAGFWAGSDYQGSASWYVTQGGYMVAQSGQIGGWNINNGSLTSGSITLSASGNYISGGEIRSATYRSDPIGNWRVEMGPTTRGYEQWPSINFVGSGGNSGIAGSHDTIYMYSSSGGSGARLKVTDLEGGRIVWFVGNASIGALTSDGMSIHQPYKLSMGQGTRQMINLYNTGYGIGVQASTTYFRSDGGFAWHKGGSHSDGDGSAGSGAGGGTTIMRVTSAGQLHTSTGTVQTSSLRVKSNIQTVERNSLGDIMALRPVTFKRTDLDGPDAEKIRTGLIAEEVAEVIPEFVAFGVEGEAQGVDYAGLTTPIIHAIQQQQREIIELRARVEELTRNST